MNDLEIQHAKNAHIAQAISVALGESIHQYRDRMRAQIVEAMIIAASKAPLNDPDVGTYDWSASIAVDVFLGTPR